MNTETKLITNANEAGYFHYWQKKHPAKLKLTPYRDESSGKVVFRAEGCIEEALQALMENKPAGSRDLLEALQATRSIIFQLK